MVTVSVLSAVSSLVVPGSVSITVTVRMNTWPSSAPIPENTAVPCSAAGDRYVGKFTFNEFVPNAQKLLYFTYHYKREKEKKVRKPNGSFSVQYKNFFTSTVFALPSGNRSGFTVLMH